MFPSKSLLNLVIPALILVLASTAAATDKKIVTVTNTTTSTAAGLSVVMLGAGSDVNVSPYAVIVSGSAACGIPTVPSNGISTSTVVILWPSACIPPGATVTFVVATMSLGPMGYSPLVSGSIWMSTTGASLGSLGSSVTVMPMLGGSPPLSIPITATVVEPTTGATATPAIGTLSASAGPTCVSATFSVAPSYTWLDGAHDFKFVQVVSAYIVGGDHAGTSFPMANFFAFPAVDPPPCVAPAGCVPASGMVGADAFPYYVSEAFWATGTPPVHSECVSSSMTDCPGLSPGATDEMAIYHTFVVVDDGPGAMLGATEFNVLGGFAWYYNDMTGGKGIIGPIPANPALISAALALGPAPFPSWTPVTGSVLGADMEEMGCWTFAPTSPFPPTIWADCAPKLGTTFTLHAKVAPPSGLLCPIGAGCSIGGAVYYAIAVATLSPAFDLAAVGIAPAESCFLYVPADLLLLSTGTLSDAGIWTQSLPVPSIPALVGMTFYTQAFQAVTYVPPLFGPPVSGFAITPYLAETVLP